MSDFELLLRVLGPVLLVALWSFAGRRRVARWTLLLGGVALYALSIGLDRGLGGALAGPTTGRLRALALASAERVLASDGQLAPGGDRELWSGPKPHSILLDLVDVAWAGEPPVAIESAARAALAAESGRPPLGALRLALRESWLTEVELERADRGLRVDGTLEELSSSKPVDCWFDHGLVRQARGGAEAELATRVRAAGETSGPALAAEVQLRAALGLEPSEYARPAAGAQSPAGEPLDPARAWLQGYMATHAKASETSAQLSLLARAGDGPALSERERIALAYEAGTARSQRFGGLPHAAWQLEALGALLAAGSLGLGLLRRTRP